MHLLFTDGAFASTTLVLFGSTSFTSILYFIGLTAVRTLVVSVANGIDVATMAKHMVRVTVLTKEGSMTRQQREEGDGNLPGPNGCLASVKSRQSF